MTIPVMKPWLGEEEQAAAAAAIASGWVAQGPRVGVFERAFADHVGVAEAVAVTSCTTALHLCLHVSGVGPGDDVVVPSFSFIATANVARHVGANPVFADVETMTGNVTEETVTAALTPATRAVIVVHQAGVPAEVDAIRSVCDARGITIIEDAACAAGSTGRGRPVGADAGLAAFSFHPRKLLTTGEGGMVTTTEPKLAGRLRQLREHGMSVSAADRHASDHPVMERYLETGFNYRMTDIQAAVGLVQLRRLRALVERRRELARRYQAAFGDVPGLRCIEDPPHGQTNFQSFWIELGSEFPMSRDELLDRLARAGISARRGIMAAHLEPAYEGTGPWNLPATEWLTTHTLILPLFHELADEDQQCVVDVVRSAGGCGPRALTDERTSVAHA